MDKTLKDYCKSKGVHLSTGYRWLKNGQIPDVYKNNDGIFVKEQSKQPQILEAIGSLQSPGIQQFSVPPSDISLLNSITPLGLSDEESEKKVSRAATRVNRSALTEEFNRFDNIDQGYLPFSYGTGSSGTNLSVKDTIVLTQKAYFNFPIVRNVIDMMTEFSASKIYLTGGNETSRNFFGAYFNAINISNFQDRFFREYYRSGNVFVYPLKVKLRKEDVNEWIKEFRLNQSVAGNSISIALRYVILNPADIEVSGSSSFVNAVYHKVLTPYELQALKTPKTPEDEKIFQSLPLETKTSIKKGGETTLRLSLNNIYPIFYKKQDYEPFAVPMVFPVLDDIEWKSELKKIDKAISRTVQQAVLLITVGYESKDGKYVVNKDMMAAIQTIFKNESVGRVLINDFTTDAKFIIPEIGDILDPKKYQIVNEDIKNGLNDILMGGSNSEKFANQSIKVKVFIARLTQARETFLNDFLIPEIKRISKLLGFKSYPEPKFEDIDLEDSIEWVRSISRLLELGALTPEETFEAIDTGRLPSNEESIESQEKFKVLKDKGYYEPLIGGPATQKELADRQIKVQMEKMAQPSGRPPGSNRPQSTKNVKPMGAKGETYFSAIKVRDNLILADKLQRNVDKFLCKKFKLKELNSEQKEISKSISELIIINEEPNNWEQSIESYASNPIDRNKERVNLLNDIAVYHELDNYLAGILLNSIKE